MLIKIKTEKVIEQPMTELQKAMLNFLPHEQVKKFRDFPHLVEPELLNEAREPEIENTIKDLFDALHERNTPKLLKVLQGDKKRIFYTFKKQLEMKERLTKREAEMLLRISQEELSLLTLSLMRD